MLDTSHTSTRANKSNYESDGNFFSFQAATGQLAFARDEREEYKIFYFHPVDSVATTTTRLTLALARAMPLNKTKQKQQTYTMNNNNTGLLVCLKTLLN